MNQRGFNSVMSILSLLIGIGALVVAISAYNRTGQNFSEALRGNAQEAQTQINRSVTLLNIERKLLQIRSDIQQNEVTVDTQRLADEIREEAQSINLGTSFDNQLVALQNELEEGTEDVGSVVDSMLSQIRNLIEADR